MIKAVVFDMDGVLCASEQAFVNAISEVLSDYGIHPKYSDFREISGASDDRFIGYVVNKYGGAYLPSMKQDAYRRYAALAATGVKGFPGVRDLIDRLKADGYLIAIASSADFEKVRITLQALDLQVKLFDAIVAGDAVEEAKPSPQVFLKAAELLGLAPATCVALDDSPLGIRGARAAGMRTIAILTDRKKEEFDAEKPDFFSSKTALCYPIIKRAGLIQ